MDFFILFIAIIFIYFVHNNYFHKRERFNLPPGPYGFPMIGSILNIEPVRSRCFAEWSRVYGPIISFRLGSSLNIVVSSPKLAREVLKEHDQVLANRPRNGPTTKLTKDGKGLVWADYGQHYAKVRRLCVHELFSQKSLEVLRAIREEEVRDMVKFIAKDCNGSNNLVLRKYLSSVAFNCTTRMVFGTRFTSADGVINEQGLEFKQIVAETNKQGALLSILDYVPWLGYIFRPKYETLVAHVRRRDRLIRGIIQEHINNSNKGCCAKKEFLRVLLDLQDRYDLSEEIIMELLWDMVTAGMDTIAISVEWTMAEVVKNPRVQKKVQEELDRVIGLDQPMTEIDLSNLPYLQCLAKEALRLHPPTPLMLPHKASANVKIGGYDIPKGSIVFVNVWAIGRDPKAWKDPLEFRPERFLEEDVDMKGQNFKLLPFGSGRRVCPAAQLSNILVTSMLGHLLHHFSWTTTEEINMEESPGLVCYMKYPLEVVPKLRLPSHMYDI